MKRLNTEHAKTSKRKKQIIEGALSCFNEFGVTETGMADICSRSKTSIGSIYHHFKSKEQLAAAVFLEGIKNYQDGYLDILESQKDAEQGIRAVVGYHLNWIVDHPEWSRYLFKESQAKFLGETKETFKQLNDEFFARCGSWFKQHMQSGVIKKLPPDIFISILMGPCQTFSRQYLFHQTCSDIGVATKEISQAIWQALKTEQNRAKT
jgi:AcrR family transcriptional regulator